MSRRLQSSKRSKEAPRKARYQKFDEEYEFTTQDKAAYFARLGLPILAGVVVVVAIAMFLVSSFRSGVSQGEATAEEEQAAEKLLGEAVRLSRSGDDPVAEAQLKRLMRTYGNTTAAEIAREALDRYAQGEPMFAERMIRSRPSLAAAARAGAEEAERKKERERTAGTAASGGSNSSSLAGNNGPSNTRTLSLYERKERARNEPPVFQLFDSPPENARISLPDGYQEDPQTKYSEAGWPAVILCKNDGYSEMVLVPEYTFKMGTNGGAENEQPVYEVTVSMFYIDRFEVTRGRYQKFLEENPDHPRLPEEAMAAMPTPEHPVVGVTYVDAEDYCAWAGKELPSEAQWALAARGPRSVLFPWGDDPKQAPAARGHRVIQESFSHPVDRSPFGVFDLSGNAAEWCFDWYSDRYDDSNLSNPVGPREPLTDEWERVIRGGDENWTVAWRGRMPQSQSAVWLGFRGVLRPLLGEEEATTVARRAEDERDRTRNSGHGEDLRRGAADADRASGRGRGASRRVGSRQRSGGSAGRNRPGSRDDTGSREGTPNQDRGRPSGGRDTGSQDGSPPSSDRDRERPKKKQRDNRD